ncbi:DUF2490 domain-containing protein [Mucilaginibacter robiniae]|uniref:DUF2490 domain-containing protein n=1 Tax=Mucilaginibacter robiniae TaxID=2728022 RepID=A0A7L5E4B5_9SPHI|nr:DUF2490 domain-containing protein [Mucilaginibacter robiniae]QJD97448.1 DUF2490 domain-containing protein [Mucilaginibacter robiniae]
MRKILLSAFIIVQLLNGNRVKAQRQEFSGWGAYFHTQKFSKHWGALFDAQFRSADEIKYLKHPLIRPALSYYFNPNQLASVGYLFTGTYNHAPEGNTFRREHRSFEQFIHNHKVNTSIAVQHRFRLEQRYVDQLQEKDAFFAQRFRYFVRGVVPFKKESTFNKGAFVGLQNEVFANVQNRDKVNGSIFDQNRAYVALGYRVSKQFDVEAGYLNQFINQVEQNTMNHILQVALYTRLGF